ncbi:MAG: hypothetical protein R2752_11180 [Vicinamibacterales bacterium]
MLRAVDPRTFADDSLRVLRGLQFAARFELTMDEATKALCRSLPLDDLRPSGCGAKSKLLLRAARPSIVALALELGWCPGCGRNWRRSSGVRRSPNGTRRATSGCTRCWSPTRRAGAWTASRAGRRPR